jgi:S-adenosylmethionine-diacylglycerol 3-amino-3-carboxypropyl transferase
MSLFFNRLNYSFGNEDWKTERKALNLQASDRVVCITASGDRPLNLLLNDCHEMIAVDLNPHQNYLLDLKVAAMKALDFNDYFGFLEGRANEKEKIDAVFSFLKPDGRAYWEKNKKQIKKGVLYQGCIERWTKIVSHCVKFFRKNKVDRLFAFKDLDEQKRFIREEWDVPAWRKLFEYGMNPIVTRFILKDPGLHKYLDKDFNVGKYIYERMNRSLENGLAGESVLSSLLLQGKVLPDGHPPYLNQISTPVIKSRLDKLSVVQANVVDYLESMPDNSVDAFSISDVASYLSPRDFERLVQSIARTAKPESRFCLRQFLSNHKIPQPLQSILKRDTQLEQELEKKDSCFVYRFIIGNVKK